MPLGEGEVEGDRALAKSTWAGFFLSPLLFPLPSYDLAPGERVEEGRNYCTALYKNVTRLRRTEFERSSVAEMF